jgi:hypothetical protein
LLATEVNLLVKRIDLMHNSARVIFPCHQEHQRCIDFLLQLFVMGAVGDEYPNCIFPPLEEIAVFMEDAATFIFLVGNGDQALYA